MFVAVVPAYQEARNIARVVAQLQEIVDCVVVVDDGSNDNTTEVARAAGARVLRHRINRGQGAALETGPEYAISIGADHVVDFDGDGQFDVVDIRPALVYLRSQAADLLLGSRFLGRAPALPITKRYLILPLARWFHRCCYGVRHSDAHNGFRIYTARALETIRIQQDRMAHATEIPAQANRAKLSVVEFPVTVTYHRHGQSGLGSLIILKDLFLRKFHF